MEETEREEIGDVALHQAVAHDLIFELLVCKCRLIAISSSRPIEPYRRDWLDVGNLGPPIAC